MAEDYFEGGGESGGSSMQEDDSHVDRKNVDTSHTTLINSDICPGMKVGDTMELHIVEVHDKEYLVAYEPEKEGEGEGEGMEKAEMPPSAGEPGMMD